MMKIEIISNFNLLKIYSVLKISQISENPRSVASIVYDIFALP